MSRWRGTLWEQLRGSIETLPKLTYKSPLLCTAFDFLVLSCFMFLRILSLSFFGSLSSYPRIDVSSWDLENRWEQPSERQRHKHHATHNEVGRVHVHALNLAPASKLAQPATEGRANRLVSLPFRQSQKQLKPRTVPQKPSVWTSSRIRCDPQRPPIVGAPCEQVPDSFCYEQSKANMNVGTIWLPPVSSADDHERDRLTTHFQQQRPPSQRHWNSALQDPKEHQLPQQEVS